MMSVFVISPHYANALLGINQFIFNVSYGLRTINRMNSIMHNDYTI